MKPVAVAEGERRWAAGLRRRNQRIADALSTLTPSQGGSVIDLGGLPGSSDSDAEGIIVAVIGGCLLTGGYGSLIGACLGASTYGVVQCRPCSGVQTQGPDISPAHGCVDEAEL